VKGLLDTKVFLDHILSREPHVKSIGAGTAFPQNVAYRGIVLA